jgi:hypothetical protein
MRALWICPLVVLTILLNSQEANAQGCCTVGASSLGGLETSVQPFKTLAVSLNYQFNSITTAFLQTTRIEDPLKRTATVGYFNLQVEYGLQPDLSLFGLLTYSDKEREITVVSNIGGTTQKETAVFRGSGVGDLMVLGKYRVVAASFSNPYEIAVGGGASLPTGSYTEEHQGSQLSIDLQPGTGAPALIAWGFGMYNDPALGLNLLMSVQFRYSSSNFNAYRIGNELSVHTGGEYRLGENFSGSLFLRGRFSSVDYSNGRFLNATGGTYYDLMPGIGYADGPSLFRIFGQFPLYRNVRGIQLTLSSMLGAEYRYTFDFSSGGSS